MQKKHVMAVLSVLALLSMSCWASDMTIKDLAVNFLSQFESFGKLLIAMAYISGLGFAVAANFKLKQHRDNPNQVPVGMPISLFLFSVFLVFLPSLYKPAGESMFGDSGYGGGFEGGGINYLPNGAGYG
jgi:intracellular multiplication protein IcmD